MLSGILRISFVSLSTLGPQEIKNLLCLFLLHGMDLNFISTFPYLPRKNWKAQDTGRGARQHLSAKPSGWTAGVGCTFIPRHMEKEARELRGRDKESTQAGGKHVG
jgi:hypothetical protein